jgi:hypothetical protein
MALTGFSKSTRSAGIPSLSFDTSPSKSTWVIHHPIFSGVDTGPHLTEQQILQLLYRRKQKPHRSFLGNVKHAGSVVGHPIEWTLDKTMRPLYAIAEATRAREAAQKKGASFGEAAAAAIHGLGQGFHGHKKTTFSDVLRQDYPKFAKHHKVLTGAAGLTMDIVADPTTYLTLGTSAIGKTAARTASEAVLKGAGKVTTKEASRKAIQDLLPHVATLEHAGKDYTHRAALGKITLDLLGKRATGEGMTQAEHGVLNLARAAAHDEMRMNTPRGLHINIGGVKTKPLPVALPSMEKIAGAHIPVVSKTVDRAGRYFVPQYGNRIEHAVMMGRKHQGERLTQEYLDRIRTVFADVPRLSEKEQIAALHFFEKKGGVIKQGEGYVLNPQRIAEAKKAGLTEAQLKFVQSVHDTGEFLASRHRAFGVKFKHMGEEGKMYVPHVVAKDGTPISDVHASLLTPRGFQKNRKGEYTVHQLEQMRRAGKLPRSVVTNPYELLAMSARAAAHKHADQTAIEYLTRAIGTPTKQVDKASLDAARARLDEVTKLIASHPAAAKGSYAEAQKAFAKAKKVAVEGHQQGAALRLQRTLDRNGALIRKHLDRDHLRTTMATVQRISNRSKAAQASYQAELKAMQSGTHGELKKSFEALRQEHFAQHEELRSLKAEAQQLTQSVKTLRTGKKLPYDKTARKTVQGITDEHGHPLHFDPETANAIEKVKKVMSGDEATIMEFSRGYRKALGKWKLAVTSINPGYGIRNTLSDYWNMWLAGVPAAAMAVYSGKAAKLMRDAKKGDAAALAEIRDAYDHGVLSGLFPGDVQQVSHMLEHSGSKKALVKDKRFLKLSSKVMQDANRNRENWGRLTHYLYRREHEGLSAVESAQWVKKAHFDYEDLTEFEQKVMKGIAPFYTWSRKNIPYQIERLFMAPGRYAAFPKAANESTQAAGGDVPSVPDYLAKNMAFRVPFMGNGYMLPMIGVTDLMKADPRNIGDTFGQMANPAFKVPFELAANRSLFTGRDIYDKTGHPRTPVSRIGGDLLSLIPGTNVGPTSRQGQRSVGADPRAVYLLNQLGPLAGLLTKQNAVGEATQGKWKVPAAYLSGINVSKVDPQAQAMFDELDTQDAFKGYLAGLRDEGIVPRAKKRKKSANQRLLEEALRKSLEGR